MRRLVFAVAALAAFTIAPGLAVAAAPEATTAAATKVTATTATLNGVVDPNMQSTTYFFEYGTTTGAYTTQTGTQAAGDKSGPKQVSADITGLTPSTTYFFRIVATNASGEVARGAEKAFTTPATQPPGTGNGSTAVTVAANPKIVVFGRTTTISGDVRGPQNSGVRVELESNPHPFTGGFKTTGITATTDSKGRYSLTIRPKKFTRYRVSVKAPAPATSAVVEVFVRYLVAFRVNDSDARRGQLIKFSGFVKPAHDGRTVRIQRKIGTGAYRTISTTRLRDTTIAGRSVFSKRLRVRRTARYRIRIGADADHLTGTSRSIAVRVS